MKHNLKITIVILLMFLVTQFIGLYVVNYYMSENVGLPLGLETPTPETGLESGLIFSQIIVAFIIAILLLLLLSKIKAEIVLKLWFFAVIIIALTIALISFLPDFSYKLTAVLIASAILAFFKVFYRNFLVHNITELLVYPGIAAVFVPLLIWKSASHELLKPIPVIALLVLISVYDMWAVWHSGIMQKMAKFQIDKLKIFSGFFVPYMTKSTRKKVKIWKKELSKKELKKKKIKINVAILGGGDIVFPIITAGVMLEGFGFYHALFVILGAVLGLSYLFFISEKKKFYPAMPFITTGILAGILLSYLVL